MDFSKLPKLSQTPVPPPDVPAPVTDQPDLPQYRDPPPRAGLAEAWISVGVGIFLLLFQPRFTQWICSRLFHTHFDEFMMGDTVVPYTQVPAFWSDLGPWLFGIVLILDGLALFTRRRVVIWPVFILTVATTLYNLGYFFASYRSYGLAPLSFLAVLFGGYIAYFQWSILTGRPQSI